MNKLNQFISIFKAFARDSLRNKVETFFSILFPILFFILFGFIFGDENGGYSGERIGFFISKNFSEETKKIVLKSNAWNSISYDSLDSMKKAIREGEILLGVNLYDSRIEFMYYESDPSRNSRIGMMITTISTFLRKTINKIEDVLSVRKIPIQVGKVSSNQMSYITAGVLAISLLSTGMFSMITLFGRYRKKAVLKRIIASPLDPIVFIVGSTLTKLLISFISTTLILLIGTFVFKLVYSFNWPLFIISIISSTLGMMAFGILLLITLKRPEAAQTAGSILMTLMIFFSGVYFPIEFLPKSLRIVSDFLPVKYVAQLFRYTAGIENMSSSMFWLVNFVLFFSGVILISISGKLFLRAN